MALSTAQIGDLEQYKGLSTHIVSILDTESRIETAIRQLSTANIVLLNSTYANVITRINEIVSSQATLT